MLFALFIFSVIAVFAIIEYYWPRQAYTGSPCWKIRGIASVLVYLLIASNAAKMWDTLLANHTLFDLGQLPLWQQVTAGLLTAQFLRYWWHRALHASNFLWRFFHQIHHSPERVDVWGALMFGPLDLIAFTLIGSLGSVGIMGLSPDAVEIFAVITIFMALWQHCNIQTPYWLGFLVVRPESHAVHHQRGAHKSNYCDLPIIDMCFGTFKNPRIPLTHAGFYDGASLEIGRMLMGVDICEQQKGYAGNKSNKAVA